MRKFNIVILILWMIVIFLFSQDPGASSSDKSDTIATFIVNVISNITGNDYSDTLSEKIENCVFIVRKSAHFLEYFILGVLIINVLKDYKVLSIKIFILSILFCLLYAIGDEVHQLFIPQREGRVLDVLIDTSGSIIGVSIYCLINKVKNRK